MNITIRSQNTLIFHLKCMFFEANPRLGLRRAFILFIFILFFGHVDGVTDHYFYYVCIIFDTFAVSFKYDNLTDSSPRL